jgi:hypothetical protein
MEGTTKLMTASLILGGMLLVWSKIGGAVISTVMLLLMCYGFSLLFKKS